MTPAHEDRTNQRKDFRQADPALAAGTDHEGFVVERVEAIEEIGGFAYVMRHRATGARLMWLACPDENRSFAIAFKTPPADDTGVFHIIEHSVLDGSARYPTKEPFVHLLKSSMQTFLNALTFPDKTMYPVASTNVADLENLMSVYLDAVLDPNIYRRQRIFEQEGWHLEVEGEGAEQRLVYNGIVLNEMKGALSDPDEVLFEALNRQLFPESPYRFESGGDPRAIPTLTYEGFLDAHARHYQLSNSYTILYGDLDIERELAFVGKRFDEAPKRDAGDPNPLPLQAPVAAAPERVEMATAPENASVGVAYVLPSYDYDRTLGVDILLDALMGSNEAPLKRELMAAGLADDVTCALADGMLQPIVIFQLKGAKPGVAERFRTLLEDACRRLAEEGIDRRILEASLAQAEFNLREHDYHYPEGVAYSMQAMSSWLYDDEDSCSFLRYGAVLDRLKAGLAEGAFERLLAETTFDCPHSALVDLVPVTEADGSPEAAELDARLAAMGEGEVAAVRKEAAELHAEQNAPDDPAAIATLPRLTVADIGDAVPEPTEFDVAGPVPTIRHAIPTDRIDYVYVYFDLAGVGFDELPYVSILSDVLGKLATERHTATELDTLCELELGSISFFCDARSRHGDRDDVVCSLGMGASVLSDKVESAAEIPCEIWSSTRFDDHDRIRDVLQQRKISLEQLFLGNGHTCALARSSASFSRLAVVDQQLSGVDFYLFLKDLLAHYDERFDDLCRRLADLSRRIFSRGGARMSFTGPEADLERWQRAAAGLALSDAPRETRLAIPEPRVRNEAFIVPGNVCFVGETRDAQEQGMRLSGPWMVANRVLSLGYLWNEIRVKGGAYGCGFRSSDDAMLQLYSYRGPSVDPTAEAFAGAGAWLAGWQPDRQEFEGFVISTVSGFDTPRKPREIARQQDILRAIGRPLGWRAQLRGEALAADADAIRSLASTLEGARRHRATCVFGGRAPIEDSALGLEVTELMTASDLAGLGA